MRENSKMSNWLKYMRASIHFPLAREDDFWESVTAVAVVLQSTSLLRGKTILTSLLWYLERLQSTSLLRGKTQILSNFDVLNMLQSTSLLRGKTISLPLESL